MSPRHPASSAPRATAQYSPGFRSVLLICLVALTGIPPASAAAAAASTPAARVEMRIARDGDVLNLEIGPLPPAKLHSLRIRSDRNAQVSRYSDVSPLQPIGGKGSQPHPAECWYPVIDFVVDPALQATVELARLAPATQLAWNGWIWREKHDAAPRVRFPASRLLQWENTLWADQATMRLADFYCERPLPGSGRDARAMTKVELLTPDWSGRLEVVAENGMVIASRRVESPASPPASTPPQEHGFARPRLLSALAEAVDYTLRSQVRDPHDPMRGGLYLFYDLDARTYRTSHWIWGWGPSAGLLLDARRIHEINARFGAAQLVRAAERIGAAALATVPHDPDHPARGIPISRWDRGPRYDFGHEAAFTPCDAGFLAAWTWLPLAEATGDPKWLKASQTLADALARLMATYAIPPQNYWPDQGRWDERTIDEAGFGVELFDGLYRITGDKRMRQRGERYIEQHVRALGRPDGLWDRTYFRDGRPNQPTIRMTRGMGWPMEGLLAAHRLLPESSRYLDLARQMANHLLASQHPDGWWMHRFDQPVETWGIGTKGTALWCWLLYELHRHTGEARHLAAARRALGWLLDEQYFGEDRHARGGHVAVSPHSAVGIRPWFRVTCTYGSAFFGLAILQELRLSSGGPAERG